MLNMNRLEVLNTILIRKMVICFHDVLVFKSQ